MNNSKKIAVAMSGGVDSSVAALLLKNSGSDVIGVNLNLWSCFKSSRSKTCCSPEDRQDARKVCEKLDIPFISIDLREQFKEQIILQFVKEYSEGRTPNPCIRCNTLIKFDAMLKWLSREMGIEQIATGHYARTVNDESGFHLLKGVDPNKDQTYFLYDVPIDILKKVSFPLGELNKSEVRKLAIDAGLPVAEKTDSQEVCFIPDGEVASFIEDHYPDLARPAGNFVDKNGKVLGRHRGTHAYTIGQRRGLGVGFGERRYVTAIRAETSEVVLGFDDELFKDGLSLKNVNLLEAVGDEFASDVKIRYKSEPVPATIKMTSNNSANVEFKSAVRAVTPGQAAVFYREDVVLGGGWIKG